MSDESKPEKLVLWSGGCDSTLVLRDLLQDNNGSRVVGKVKALTIIHDQVPAAREQYEARERIRAKLQSEGYLFEHATLTLATSGHFFVVPGGCAQSCLWMTNVLLYCSILENTEVYTGHIQYDDYWRNHEKFESMFDQMSKALCRKVAIQHPLGWTHKSEIIQRLKGYELLDLCWWCEAPENGQVCHKCNSCVTHDTARYQIEKWPDKFNSVDVKETTNEDIQKAATDLADVVEELEEKIEGKKLEESGGD